MSTKRNKQGTAAGRTPQRKLSPTAMLAKMQKELAKVQDEIDRLKAQLAGDNTDGAPEGFMPEPAALMMSGKSRATFRQYIRNGAIEKKEEGWRVYYKRADILQILLQDEQAKRDLIWYRGMDGAIYTELGQLIMTPQEYNKRLTERRKKFCSDTGKTKSLAEQRKRAKNYFAAQGIKLTEEKEKLFSPLLPMRSVIKGSAFFHQLDSLYRDYSPESGEWYEDSPRLRAWLKLEKNIKRARIKVRSRTKKSTGN